MLKMSRTFILHNNDSKKFLTNWLKKLLSLKNENKKILKNKVSYNFFVSNEFVDVSKSSSKSMN